MKNWIHCRKPLLPAKALNSHVVNGFSNNTSFFLNKNCSSSSCSLSSSLHPLISHLFLPSIVYSLFPLPLFYSSFICSPSFFFLPLLSFLLQPFFLKSDFPPCYMYLLFKIFFQDSSLCLKFLNQL